jgi:CheY-like chemotaxis protein
LSVVHGIVEQSGGHVSVTSAPGMGTSFRVVLPAVQHTETPASGTLAIEPPKGSETILLVEDEENVRRIAVRTLRQNGYTILEAADGPTALQMVRNVNGAVDMLITDVVMPHMGGREVAEAVRALAPGIKVMFSSGYTDDAVVRHGVLEADVAFLQKPFTGKTLLARVREVLDTRGTPPRVP